MESLGVHCEIETQVAALLARLASHHVDGVVVDCDGVEGADGLLPLIRAGSCNQLSTIIAVVDGKTGVNQAMSLGASFVLSKPVSPLRLQPYLKTLVGPMEREHWRYFRHHVELPVILVCSDQPLAARTVNVSENGLALRCSNQGSLDSSLLLKLQLPYPGTGGDRDQRRHHLGRRPGIQPPCVLFVSAHTSCRVRDPEPPRQPYRSRAALWPCTASRST